MTPPSQSAVSLVPEPPPPPAPRVASTQQMAAEAAVAAGVTSAGPSNSAVKIVGIIAGSLTAVAVAALIVFGAGGEPSEPAPVVTQDDSAERAERLDAAAAAHRVAADQAEAAAKTAERAELEAAFVRTEAARLKAELAAKPEPKRTRRPRRTRPKPAHGDDFDIL